MPRLRTLALTLTALVALTGCESLPDNESHGRDKARHANSDKPGDKHKDKPGKPSRPAADGTALAALAALPVKGRAPMTGYDRAQFGAEWSDAAGNFTWSRNGCDTRNDVLARDLQREIVESNGCVVTSGVLAYEPYTGQKNYYFDKHDNDYATDLDVEHVVALGNAWATGAQQLSADERAALANDPINLYLSDPSQNRSKSDADFATWLPPNKAFRCSYAARQIRVKTVYGLWVTAPEKAAMERVLATCPNEPLKQPEVQAGRTAHAVAAPPTSAPTSAPAAQAGGVAYANCAEVIAAGAAPIRRGDPGYGAHLDGDGDGSACE